MKKWAVLGIDLGKANPGFQLPAIVFSGTKVSGSQAGGVWRARSLVQGWADDLKRLRVTRQLLRTAEKVTGLPCATSGVLHGIEAAAPSTQGWVLDGQHRLAAATQLIRAQSGSGKTEAALALMHRLGRMQRMGKLSASSHVANDADVLVEFLRGLTQSLLSGSVPHIRHLVAVLPHESSPCGVLRLAVPIIPGAPGQGPADVPFDLALAA